MIRKPILIVSLASILTGGLTLTPASADPLSRPEINGILQELTNIEDVLSGKRVSLRTNAVQAFEAASSSEKAAYEFYVQCHKVLNFDAKDASFSDFRAWRERDEKRTKTKENIAAMRLQLQYLVLTMKAAEGVKKEFIIPELESFVANIVNHTEDLGSNGMRTLNKSVKTTIFAEAYKLNKSLEIENWCFEPGSLGGVYEKSVFPYMRSEARDNLGAAWDRRIQLEKRTILITRKDNEYELNKFETEKLPQLHWQKANDIYLNFSQKQGSQSMLALIKSNPNHTSLKSWVEGFRELLLGSTPPITAPPITAPPIPDTTTSSND